MKELLFSIVIHASKEHVWKTLWQSETFTQWASVIDPETYMKGDLVAGQEVQFLSGENGYGVTSLVEKVIPGEFLLLRHREDTQKAGTQNREDQWTGGEERYELVEKDGSTTLTVRFGVPPELEEYFLTTYPKALETLRSLVEKT